MLLTFALSVKLMRFDSYSPPCVRLPWLPWGHCSSQSYRQGDQTLTASLDDQILAKTGGSYSMVVVTQHRKASGVLSNGRGQTAEGDQMAHADAEAAAGAGD